MCTLQKGGRSIITTVKKYSCTSESLAWEMLLKFVYCTEKISKVKVLIKQNDQVVNLETYVYHKLLADYITSESSK